jgi:hypothetical protein
MVQTHITKLVERTEDVAEIVVSANGSFENHAIIPTGTREAARLPAMERRELLDECYRLWKYDALGGTIVSLTTYFVLGRGLTYQFEDEDAQFYIEKFYKKNNLDMKLRSASDESTAFGDVFIWLRPHADTVVSGQKKLWNQGDVQVTFIDPYCVTHIRVADEDPSDVYEYIYMYEDSNMVPQTVTIPHISKFDINSGNMDVFGHGDLIRVKEWLDNYQEYLRDGVVINKLYRSPCFDISIENGTQMEVNAAVARYRGWQIGTNPVHNANETWSILEFTGPNSSSENSRRSLLLMIAAGVGFAEFMLADGANANLASSKSQQLPVIKKFQDRQDIWTEHLMQMFQFILMVKAELKSDSGLSVDKDREGDPVPFEGKVAFPAIAEERDVEVAQTNQVAMEGKYMSPRTAAGRLKLNYEKELALMKNDRPLVEELEELGVFEVPPDPMELMKAQADIDAKAMGNEPQKPGDDKKKPTQAGKPDGRDRPEKRQKQQDVTTSAS